MKASQVALAAAVAAATSYVASWDLIHVSDPVAVAWKGAGVAFLAVYAALSVRGTDGRLIAAVMAFGALGDMLLETHGLVVGALAFLAGHLTAIWLYLKNQRTDPGLGRTLACLALIPVVTGIAFLLPVDRAGAPGIALYSLGLSAMAATAWMSRFPRALTGIGALMFVVSDLLIFLRAGRPELDTFAIGIAVWGLYFAGQALIAVGVVRTLAAQPYRATKA